MLDKSVRLKGLIIVISIFLSGCSTLEKNLLFQKNTQNEEQKKLKVGKEELPADERKVLQNIEKNLENITLNITKLSDENAKTFEKISSKVNIPVIASGGVGNLDHLVDGIKLGNASAVLAASIFHYGKYSVREAKEYLNSKGIPVRI